MFVLGQDLPIRIQEHPEAAATIIIDKPFTEKEMLSIFRLLHHAKPLGVRLFLKHQVPGNSEFPLMNLISEETLYAKA